MRNSVDFECNDNVRSDAMVLYVSSELGKATGLFADAVPAVGVVLEAVEHLKQTWYKTVRCLHSQESYLWS